MLVLFKPFVDFQDLYNDISWEDSFENTDFGEHLQYIRNVQEMYLGLQEKQNKLNDDGTGGKNGDDDDDDDMDHEEMVMDDEIDDSNALLQETLIDSATSLALEEIKNSDCLTNIPCSTVSPADYSSFLQQQQWKSDIQQQKEEKQKKCVFRRK